MLASLWILGAIVAATLVSLMLLTLTIPSLRIWPTPGEKTWQSYVFWPLFRGLNVLCFAVAAAEVATNGGLSGGQFVGLPTWLRIVAFALLLVSIAVFLYAFFALGRDNSYGADHGLVTGGIYQWTRNPQNAMLIVVYACLAVAADSVHVYGLCGAMIAVYALMVLAEEPWLESVYGEGLPHLLQTSAPLLQLAPPVRYAERLDDQSASWLRRLRLLSFARVWHRFGLRIDRGFDAAFNHRSNHLLARGRCHITSNCD